MLPPPSNRVKVVVIGDSGVGKTSLINKYVNNKSDPNIYLTIGVDFYPKTVEIDRINLNLQIWDMAGSGRYGYERFLFRGTDYLILVFDVTNSMTFNDLDMWLDEINIKSGSSGIPLCVVGNKIDCNDRKVCEEEARKWCDFHNILYFETSAKTSQNITNLFVTIINELSLNKSKSNDEDSSDAIIIQNSSQIHQNNSCCY
ncbi:GTP-binding protein ypt7 [Entamoeba marina]